jgi:hypothetical protein
MLLRAAGRESRGAELKGMGFWNSRDLTIRSWHSITEAGNLQGNEPTNSDAVL